MISLSSAGEPLSPRDRLPSLNFLGLFCLEMRNAIEHYIEAFNNFGVLLPRVFVLVGDREGLQESVCQLMFILSCGMLRICACTLMIRHTRMY